MYHLKSNFIHLSYLLQKTVVVAWPRELGVCLGNANRLSQETSQGTPTTLENSPSCGFFHCEGSRSISLSLIYKIEVHKAEV